MPKPSMPSSNRYGGPTFGLSEPQRMRRLQTERDIARNQLAQAEREIVQLREQLAKLK